MPGEEDLHWILVGRPTPSPLLESLPEPLGLQGALPDRPEGTFFGVFQHPRRPGRVVALLLANPMASLETVARKIPHYGTYSYLVFRGGENRVKGVWPVTSSPLIVQWPGDVGTSPTEQEDPP
jgi:hypothetical protein